MDPALEIEARRLTLAAALMGLARRTAGRRVAPDSATAELLALARRLAEDGSAIERIYHFRFDPSYPGVSAGPQTVTSGLRLVLACTATTDDGTELGTVFTTLIPGRAPLVTVAPVGAPIPPEWRPL